MAIAERARVWNVIIVAVAVATVGAGTPGPAHAGKKRKSGVTPAAKADPADAGRELRRMMLTTPPKDFGVKPSPEFPRVFAILMDWPLGDNQIATVVSASTGDASLYTTSRFGIIGGVGHEKVRAAAKAMVKASDRHVAAARPTSEFPYPREGRVRFYFLTFDGVRVIDTDLARIENGTSAYAELFGLGQGVLTALRLISQKRE
jgi:hypothetical protein